MRAGIEADSPSMLVGFANCLATVGTPSHAFLIVSESPTPLLGRDILSKVKASIHMTTEPNQSLCLPPVEVDIDPEVWAVGGKIGRAKNAQPVEITLKNPKLFPCQKQYPLMPEA